MNTRLSEFELIQSLTHQRGVERKDVLCGVGDDAAVVTAGEKCLLFTCDAQVAGIHFLRHRISPYTLGQRIAAVNLSDIAAMGGVPLWALCSLIVPPDDDLAFYNDLYDGLYNELGRFSVQLIGGNVARTEAGGATDLFMVGEAGKDSVLYRSGAEVGDVICVTGTLGDSAAGLKLLLDGKDELGEFSALVQKHQRPLPRIDIGRILSGSGEVSACMDISDGLLQDAAHLSTASEVHLIIDDALVPVSPLVVRYANETHQDARLLALTGGEDYELLFTVKEKSFHPLQRQILQETGVDVSVVGEVVKAVEENNPVRTCGERYWHLNNRGFDHLR